MGLFDSMSKVQRANEAVAKASRGVGCWVCGTGTGGAMCSAHQKQVREAARVEGSRPLSREELGGRGW